MDITSEMANEVARCPRCRGKLVRRDPKPGGKWFRPFFGCQAFPKCRGTVEYDTVGWRYVGEDPPWAGDIEELPAWFL